MLYQLMAQPMNEKYFDYLLGSNKNKDIIWFKPFKNKL